MSNSSNLLTEDLKYSIVCSFQGFHRVSTSDNQLCEISLKCKLWITKRKLIFGVGPQKVINAMVAESKLTGSSDNEINFVIPKLQPFKAYLKYERTVYTERFNTNQKVKKHLDSMTCTSFEEIKSKRRNRLGDMIVVQQYDFSYKVYR